MTTVTQDTPKEEQQAKAVAPSKNCIILWYHDADRALVKGLDPHLQSLYRRLEPRVTRSYFCYSPVPLAPEPCTLDTPYFKEKYEEAKARYEKALKDYQNQHDNAVSLLQQRGILFVPFVSNAFMKRLHEDMEQSSTVRMLLEHPSFQIMPVLLQPTEGVSSAANALSAYEEGYHRELACVQIAALLEGVLINSGHYQPGKTPLTPQAALFSSPNTIQPIPSPQQERTVQAITETFAPVKFLLEQASTQIVEARQLALAERSQRMAAEEEQKAIQKSEAELRRQIEEMNQNITVIREEQKASLFSKIGRWLKPIK